MWIPIEDSVSYCTKFDSISILFLTLGSLVFQYILILSFNFGNYYRIYIRILNSYISNFKISIPRRFTIFSLNLQIPFRKGVISTWALNITMNIIFSPPTLFSIQATQSIWLTQKNFRPHWWHIKRFQGPVNTTNIGGSRWDAQRGSERKRGIRMRESLESVFWLSSAWTWFSSTQAKWRMVSTARASRLIQPSSFPADSISLYVPSHGPG